MPRPTRIQFPHAFYHVMNRGKGHQTIFHNEFYYQDFIKTLQEVCERFDAVIHAYCLMGNHYHLLIETPRANLDRIMRHVGGIYTQRYNRLKNTDGPLFRGRYKAILVSEDDYLLQVSRYIHRNPIEVKGVDPNVLDTYPWSSYLAYVGQVSQPLWLKCDTIYGLFGGKDPALGYRAYVQAGTDASIQRFYARGSLPNVLGDREFKELLLNKKVQLMGPRHLTKILFKRPTAKEIIEAVSAVFGVTMLSIMKRQLGRQNDNLPRKLAMYCCQQFGDIPQKEITSLFNLRHDHSVCSAIAYIKSELDTGKLNKEIGLIMSHLDITKYA